MAPENIFTSEFDNLSTVFVLLSSGDLAPDQFLNTYLDNPVDLQWQIYAQTYEELITTKISQTAIINISKLFSANVEKYSMDLSLRLYYTCVIFKSDDLFKNLRCSYDYIDNINILLPNILEFLKRSLVRGNTLWKNFQSEIMVQAAIEVSNNSLTVTDLVQMMEKDMSSWNETSMILDFAERVRVIAANQNWFRSMGEYADETEELLVGIDFAFKNIEDNMTEL